MTFLGEGGGRRIPPVPCSQDLFSFIFHWLKLESYMKNGRLPDPLREWAKGGESRTIFADRDFFSFSYYGVSLVRYERKYALSTVGLNSIQGYVPLSAGNGMRLLTDRTSFRSSAVRESARAERSSE